MATIYAAALAFRSLALAQESKATREIARVYVIASERIGVELSRLLVEYQRLVREGRAPSAAWLMRTEQALALFRSIGYEIAYASASAESIVRSSQAFQLELATAHTREILGLAEVRDVFRPPTEALEKLVGYLGDGSPLRRLFDKMPALTGAKAEQALIEGVATGKNPRETARVMRSGVNQALDLTRSRALTISRTETMRVHRDASLENYKANAEAVRGWVWLCACDLRSCPSCWAMHGTFHDFREVFGSHPNCFVAGTVIDAPPVNGSSSRWYEGEVVEVEMRSGNRFTVTPNHPILTTEGWVGAGFLDEGSRVIRALDAKAVLGKVCPDHEHVPAMIEDIAETLGGLGGVRSSRVPTSSVDFHGDGGGSEVSVVRSNCLLQDALDAPISKPLSQCRFVVRSRDSLAFSRQGSRAKLFDSARLPANSGVCSGRVLEVVLGRPERHHESIRVGLISHCDATPEQRPMDDRSGNTNGDTDRLLGLASEVAARNLAVVHNSQRPVVAQLDTGFSKHAVDYFLGDPEKASHLLTRLAGLVYSDEVIKVRRHPFEGHVYNLQTSTGWYIANGIIAHNCRCSPAPQVRGLPALIPEDQAGAARFGRLSEEDQLQVLGPKKHELYQAGRIRLEDMTVKTYDRSWGPQRHEATIAESLANAGEKRKAA